MEDFTSVKRDCFGFGIRKNRPHCSTLNEMLCQNGECGFYKTMKQFNEGQEKYPNMYALPKKNIKV